MRILTLCLLFFSGLQAQHFCKDKEIHTKMYYIGNQYYLQSDFKPYKIIWKKNKEVLSIAESKHLDTFVMIHKYNQKLKFSQKVYETTYKNGSFAIKTLYYGNYIRAVGSYLNYINNPSVYNAIRDGYIFKIDIPSRSKEGEYEFFFNNNLEEYYDFYNNLLSFEGDNLLYIRKAKNKKDSFILIENYKNKTIDTLKVPALFQASSLIELINLEHLIMVSTKPESTFIINTNQTICNNIPSTTSKKVNVLKNQVVYRKYSDTLYYFNFDSCKEGLYFHHPLLMKDYFDSSNVSLNLVSLNIDRQENIYTLGKQYFGKTQIFKLNRNHSHVDTITSNKHKSDSTLFVYSEFEVDCHGNLYIESLQEAQDDSMTRRLYQVPTVINNTFFGALDDSVYAVVHYYDRDSFIVFPQKEQLIYRNSCSLSKDSLYFTSDAYDSIKIFIYNQQNQIVFSTQNAFNLIQPLENGRYKLKFTKYYQGKSENFESEIYQQIRKSKRLKINKENTYFHCADTSFGYMYIKSSGDTSFCKVFEKDTQLIEAYQNPISRCVIRDTIDIKISKNEFQCQNVYDTFYKQVCDTFVFENIKYDKTGIYSHKYKKSDGCDSFKVLVLKSASINADVEVKDGVHFIAKMPNAMYQWYTCEWRKILNADKQIFTTLTKLSFRVVVSDSAKKCIDTSKCVDRFYSQIQTSTLTEDVKIYPNPTKDIVFINFLNIKKNIRISIKDMLGNLLFKEIYHNKMEMDISLQSFAKGIYILQIEMEDGHPLTYKIFKN